MCCVHYRQPKLAINRPTRTAVPSRRAKHVASDPAACPRLRTLRRPPPPLVAHVSGNSPRWRGAVQQQTKRWTLDEGLEANATATSAFPAASTEDLAVPTSDDNGEGTVPQALALPNRWDLNDGAADLAERGIELVGAGLCVPLSSSMRDGGGRRGHKRRRQTTANDKEEAEVSLVCGSGRLDWKFTRVCNHTCRRRGRCRSAIAR